MIICDKGTRKAYCICISALYYPNKNTFSTFICSVSVYVCSWCLISLIREPQDIYIISWTTATKDHFLVISNVLRTLRLKAETEAGLVLSSHNFLTRRINLTPNSQLLKKTLATNRGLVVQLLKKTQLELWFSLKITFNNTRRQ